MNIPIADLAAAVNFVEQHRADKMPFRIAYKFNKFISDSKDDIMFFREKYGELLREYSQKDNTGNPIFQDENLQIQKDKLDEFSKKAADIFSTQVEAPNVEFKIDELEKIEVSIEELTPLMPFIKE